MPLPAAYRQVTGWISRSTGKENNIRGIPRSLFLIAPFRAIIQMTVKFLAGSK
jgi:hypothetical protein